MGPLRGGGGGIFEDGPGPLPIFGGMPSIGPRPMLLPVVPRPWIRPKVGPLPVKFGPGPNLPGMFGPPLPLP